MAPFTSREEYERWKAQRATAGQPDTATQAKGVQTDSPSPPTARSPRPWMTGLLALLVATVAAAGWYYFSYRPERSRASVGARAQLSSWPPPVLPQERDVLRSVAFSPDGKTMATGGVDGSIQLWDVATRQPRARLGEHGDVIFSLAFASDGKTLVSGGRDGVAKIWDVPRGSEQATLLGHKHWVRAVAIAPDGLTVATGSADGTVRLWDLRTGMARATLDEGTGQVYAVAFSPDGSLLAWGGLDGATILWDMAGGRRRRRLAGNQARAPVVAGWYTVQAIAFSPDGRMLATGAAGGTVRGWDVASGLEVGSLRLGDNGSIVSLAFAPNGRKLLAGGKLWDLETRQGWPARRDPDTRSDALAPDGKLFVTVGRTVRWWDVSIGLERFPAGTEARATLVGHDDIVDTVAFAPDGKTVASGSSDRTLRLWNLADGTARATLTGHAHAVSGVAFSPNGRIIATASGDRTVKLWNAASGAELATLTHGGGVVAIAFAPDGRTLATTSDDKTVTLWDAASRRPRAILPQPMGALTTQYVQALAFAPDGKTLATAAAGINVVWLWDVAALKVRAVLEGHLEAVKALAFAPDGKTIATASFDKTVRLWDTDTGRGLAVLQGHTGKIQAVAFGPDGRTVVTAGDDRTLRVWDVPTRTAIATLRGHAKSVLAIAFAPDGRTLASAGADRTVRVWDIPSPPPAVSGGAPTTIAERAAPADSSPENVTGLGLMARAP